MKKKEEKIEITTRLPIYIDLYSLEGDTEKVIQYLKDIPNKLKEWSSGFNHTKYSDKDKLYMDNLLNCHRYELNFESWQDGTEVSIEGVRWETDEEFNTRLDTQKRDKLNAQKAAKTRKLKQEEEELKLFNKLKEKYGKET